MEAKYWIVGIVCIIAVIILIIAGIYIGTQNDIIGKDNVIEEKYGNIEACLQQRNDLIPRAVKVAKFSLDIQNQIITNYTKLRQDYQQAIDHGNLDQIDKSEEAYQAFESDLRSKIQIQVEQVPNIDITELTNVMSLMDSCERVLRTARIDFNGAVKDYNNAIEQWPGNMWAKGWGFYPKQMFNATAGAENPPEIDLP